MEGKFLMRSDDDPKPHVHLNEYCNFWLEFRYSTQKKGLEENYIFSWDISSAFHAIFKIPVSTSASCQDMEHIYRSTCPFLPFIKPPDEMWWITGIPFHQMVNAASLMTTLQCVRQGNCTLRFLYQETNLGLLFCLIFLWICHFCFITFIHSIDWLYQTYREKSINSHSESLFLCLVLYGIMVSE